MHIDANMGAQAPLYTCRAYVFQVDPDTRKSWNQLSTDAVNVQIFHDSVKNAYRIISVDGAKILVNTTITGRMSFSKTSPKFCQWVDVKANQVYGLGFADEIDLSRFINKINIIKETAKSSTRSNSVSVRRSSRSDGNWSLRSAESVQLKQENAQLKLALVQSSTNAKSWQDELEALRNNNAKLMTALQESHANVEEWKRQLLFYRDECSRLRQMICTRRSPDNESVSETKELKHLLDNTDLQNKQQEQRIGQLEHQIQRYSTEISSLRDRLNKSETINEDLRREMHKRTSHGSHSSRTSSHSPHRNLQHLIRLRDLFELKTNDFNQTVTARSHDLQRLCTQITQAIAEF